MHSDEYGAGAARFDAFVPWIPLIAFAFVPTALAAGMTNPLFKKIRRSFGLPATTKWTTLKWRLRLLSVAFVTLVIYNILFFNELNYNMLARYAEDSLTASQSPDFWVGDQFEMLVFFYLPIMCTPLFFLHGLRAAIVSHKNKSCEKKEFFLMGFQEFRKLFTSTASLLVFSLAQITSEKGFS